MEQKKYEFTGETKIHCGITLKQIRALVTIIGVVSSGDVGGWIESEKCLEHSGNAWVSGNAQVSGNAWVYGNALVSGDAWVRGHARVCDNAQVSDNAWVYGNAQVYGDARVCGHARVCDNAWVSGDARVSGNAWVYGNAQVSGDAWVRGDAWIDSKSAICAFSGFGSELRTTTAFIDKEIGIRIVCGCFTGTIEQFKEKVIETHGTESKNGVLYLQMANMIELRFAS